MKKNLTLAGKSSSFWAFSVIFILTVAFVVWWGLLLMEKNETAFAYQAAAEELQYEIDNGSSEGFLESEAYEKIHSKYIRQKIMIMTEGPVFLALVLIVLLRIRRTFVRELELAQQQRNFILSITHELKSPVSSVKLTLQTLARRKLPPDREKKLLNNGLFDVDRLETLIENILFAAKIEGGAYGFAKEKIDLGQAVKSVLQKFETAQPERSFTFNGDENVVVEGDLLALNSVFINLIENATKYSPENAQIGINVLKQQQHAVFEVNDQGIGIAEEEREKIFEKFYRVGSEDTRRTKGTGLGLYIVKRVVELHQGSIEVTKNEPLGSRFRVLLPLAPQSALSTLS